MSTATLAIIFSLALMQSDAPLAEFAEASPAQRVQKHNESSNTVPPESHRGRPASKLGTTSFAQPAGPDAGAHPLPARTRTDHGQEKAYNSEEALTQSEFIVPLRRIAPGERLNKPEVAVKKIALTRSRERYARRLDDVAGMIAAKTLLAGRPIPLRNLRREFAIRRGQSVQVKVVTGSLTIVMQGTASESGSIGDQVTIVNPSSGRVLKARVSGNGTAVVEAGK